MKRKMLLLGFSFVMSLSLLACSSQETEPEIAGENQIEENQIEENQIEENQTEENQTEENQEGSGEEQTETADEAADTSKVALDANDGALAQVNHLGELLMDELFTMDENQFFSPYSIFSAFVMLDHAESGLARQEIESVMGISDLQAVTEALSAYRENVKTSDVSLLSADSLWISDGLELADSAKGYQTILQDSFQSDIFTVDFQEPETKEAINSWVSQKTQGMIHPFIETMEEETDMVLLDALYFEGTWRTPFQPENTWEERFFGSQGETLIDTMHLYDSQLKYVELDGVLAVEIPYGEGRFVMQIFMAANEEENIVTLYEAMDKTQKENLYTALAQVQNTEAVDSFSIPKFSFHHTVDGMDTVLQKLGINAIYERGYLDQLNEELAITDVMHKARVEVDEMGTKASAVTGMIAKETAMQPTGVEIRINHPFLFVIQDTEQQINLFAGSVQNLSE